MTLGRSAATWLWLLSMICAPIATAECPAERAKRLARLFVDKERAPSAYHEFQKLGKPARAAVPVLIDNLENFPLENVWYTLLAVESLGSDARDCVPSLIAALQRTDAALNAWQPPPPEEWEEYDSAGLSDPWSTFRFVLSRVPAVLKQVGAGDSSAAAALMEYIANGNDQRIREECSSALLRLWRSLDCSTECVRDARDYVDPYSPVGRNLAATILLSTGDRESVSSLQGEFAPQEAVAKAMGELAAEWIHDRRRLPNRTGIGSIRIAVYEQSGELLIHPRREPGSETNEIDPVALQELAQYLRAHGFDFELGDRVFPAPGWLCGNAAEEERERATARERAEEEALSPDCK